VSVSAAAASVVALPVYYVVMFGVNQSNKETVLSEFSRRHFVLPLMLAAGDMVSGSFFFPMTPDPQSLNLQWSSGPARNELVLSLQALRGLHAPAPPAEALQTPLENGNRAY
jgi:hypothetical protein